MIFRAVSDSPELFSAEAFCETDSVWRFTKYVRSLGENAHRTTAYYNHFWQCTVNVGVHFRIGYRRTMLPLLAARDATCRVVTNN